MLVLLWIGSLIKNRVKAIPSHIGIVAGLYLAWMGISTLFAADASVALDGSYGRFTGLFTQILFVSLFFLAATLPLKQQDIKKILMAFALCLIPVVIIEVMQYSNVIIDNKVHLRPGGTIGNAVPLGALIAMACPFLLYFATEANGKRRKGWIILLGLFVVGLLMTWSRGPLIGFYVAMAIMAYGMTKAISRRAGMILILSIAFACAAFYTMNLEGFDKGAFSSWSIHASSSKSAQARKDLAGISWDIFKEHPVTGIGLGNFKEEIAKYTEDEHRRPFREPHNVYLDIAVSLGIPGVVLYLLLMGSVLVCVIRSESQEKDRLPLIAFIAAIVGYMVQDLTGWQHMASTPIFFIIVGLAVSFASRKKESVYLASPWRFKWLGIPAGGVAIMLVFLVLQSGQICAKDKAVWDKKRALISDYRNTDDETRRSAIVSALMQLPPR